MKKLFNLTNLRKFSILFLFFVIMNASCLAKINPRIFSFNSKHKEKIENFILLMSVIETEDQTIPESTASGFVYKTNEKEVLIITANHFCNPSHYGIVDDDFLKVMSGKRVITGFNNDKQREAIVYFYDKENDICVLRAEKHENDKFFKVKFAKKMPKVGDKVYNVAAPQGVASPNVSLLFDGYFGGCNESFNGCLFTIPATGGSSGSAVYNTRGEVISIIISSLVSFDNIAMGPHLSYLKGIKEYESLYR